MRILYAASNMQHINNFHLEYISALREEGHEVTVMASGEGADVNIPFVKKLFSRGNTEARRMIRRHLEESAYDAILINTSLAAFHIRLSLRRKRRPRVANFVHGYLFSKKTSTVKRLMLILAEKLTAPVTDSVLVMNAEDLRIAKRYKLAKSIYFTRGMGVKAREALSERDTMRAALGLSESFVLGFVGELSERKNQELLIRALPTLISSVPNAALLLVGEGAARESLESLAAELSVSDRVIFTGSRRDVPDLIDAMDVYVSAASIEGMPFNILEALGRGKTVVASDIKGHVDILDRPEVGYTYEYGNAEALVSLLKRIHSGELIPDPDQIEKTYRRYSSDAVFDETLLLVKKALGITSSDK